MRKNKIEQVAFVSRVRAHAVNRDVIEVCDIAMQLLTAPPVHEVSTPLSTDEMAVVTKTDRKAYKRKWMRKSRADKKMKTRQNGPA